MRHEGYGRTITQGENFYQYNGKELNTDFGLDMYDYGARFYDASVSRWFAVDPLAEKYVEFSPYNYVLSNPIMFVDPDGKDVLFAGSAEEEAYNNYRTTVGNRKERYQMKVNAIETEISVLEANNNRTKKENRYLKRKRNALSTAQGNLETYEGINKELDDLEKPGEIFRIRMGKNKTSKNLGDIRFNLGTQEVDINIGDSNDYNDIQKLAHELKHAHQYVSHTLDLSVDNGKKKWYDQTDEVEAFERQNLFSNTFGGSQVSGSLTHYVSQQDAYKNLPTSAIGGTAGEIQQMRGNAKVAGQEKISLIILRRLYYGWRNDYYGQ